MRAGRLALATLALLGCATIQAAPGSWVASAPAVTVSVPGHFHPSQPLAPGNPAIAGQGTITSVRWRHRVPAGHRVRAWLCAEGHHCVEVAGAQGLTKGLAGVPANMPLRMRYALPPGERKALVVTGIQAVVNHR